MSKTLHTRIVDLNSWLAEHRPGYEIRTNQAGKLEFQLYGPDGKVHYRRDTFESIERVSKR